MSEEYPLVSAIMLAGRSKIADVLHAIDCFQKQTYPYKELIIVNNAKTQFIASSMVINANKNVFVIDTPTELTAGMARNYGIKSANGRILAQFDSDYWHAPERLSTQIAAMAEHEAHVCMLSETLSYSYLSGRAGIFRNSKSIVLNTMVYIRPNDIDYPPYYKSEEFGILGKMIEAGMKPISIQRPDLCCKVVPGDCIAGEASATMNNDGLDEDQLNIIKSMVDQRLANDMEIYR